MNLRTERNYCNHARLFKIKKKKKRNFNGVFVRQNRNVDLSSHEMFCMEKGELLPFLLKQAMQKCILEF